MKYLFLSLLFIGCSSMGPGHSMSPAHPNGITVTPATECSQMSGNERRQCVQQYEQNPSDYEEVMAE